MDTGVCMYCNRTLALPELLDKGGKYRCKNEEDCLAEQIRLNAPDSPDDPEDLAVWAKSLLAEAEQRIIGYRTAETGGEASEEALTAFVGIKAAIDALAAEYREKPEYRFQPDEKGAYAIAFQAADGSGFFKVLVAPLARARYALTVAKTESAADSIDPYREFIYKSYPENQREDLLQDLAVVLLAFAGEGRRSGLLSQFKREIEARSYRKGDF